MIRQSLNVGKGVSYPPKRINKAANLTKEMLDSGGLADDTVQAVQFLDGRRKGRRWLVVPVAHGPSRVPQDSNGDGLSRRCPATSGSSRPFGTLIRCSGYNPALPVTFTVRSASRTPPRLGRSQPCISTRSRRRTKWVSPAQLNIGMTFRKRTRTCCRPIRRPYRC